MGGALGVLFAFWGIRALTLMLANGRENFTLHAGLNWHVLAVTLLLAAGLAAGYLPSRRASKIDPMAAIRYE